MTDTRKPAAKTAYKRQAGVGREMTPDEVGAYVAKFGELTPDPDAFRDANDPNRRLKIMWAISPNNMGGPAAISAPHSFHMTYIESEPGHHPVLHYHDYPEIFVCMRGQYTIHWGNKGENRVVLDPFDTFSVPPGLMRSVENTGTETGLVMVLYGDVEDPNAGIYVPQEVIDADKAAGRDI
ncbi:MAG: cupin domain-containing protein [Alphaproteobacteria bacterium]|jgi:quercetin dioxygenase-like cupin family protein